MAMLMMCDRAMVARMPMHLMMFLMNCLMRTMISNSVADVVSRSGDGDMVTTGRERGGAMVMGWGAAQGWEEWEVWPRWKIMWWGQHTHMS